MLFRSSGHHGDQFVYFALKALVADLQRGAHGSVFDTITRDTFATCWMALPPESVAANFSTIVAPFLERVCANVTHSRTLSALRDALLPKLISGEIRVPVSPAFDGDLG